MERGKPARDIGAKNFQNRCSQCEKARGIKWGRHMNVGVLKLMATLIINISNTTNNIFIGIPSTTNH